MLDLSMLVRAATWLTQLDATTVIRTTLISLAAITATFVAVWLSYVAGWLLERDRR